MELYSYFIKRKVQLKSTQIGKKGIENCREGNIWSDNEQGERKGKEGEFGQGNYLR